MLTKLDNKIKLEVKSMKFPLLQFVDQLLE